MWGLNFGKRAMTREEEDLRERMEENNFTEERVFPIREYNVRSEISEYNGKLVAQPEFMEDVVVLHPIPAPLQELARRVYSIGDIVVGRFGIEHSTGKNDRRGRPILVRYFIPKSCDQGLAA